MTPAINTVRQHEVPHRLHAYRHDSRTDSYGAEAADKLGVPANRVFKTLVVRLDSGALVVAVIPVSSQLSMKLVAKAAGARKAAMADGQTVQRSSGYVLGGVSPLGQKRALQTIIEKSATNYETIYVSAGRRGLELELSAQDLRALTRGQFSDLCQ